MASAWYHLHALEAAYEKYEEEFDRLAGEARDLWDASPVVAWRWDSWFSLPHKRALTIDEYKYQLFDYHYSPYYWMLVSKKHFTDRLKTIIQMAYQSEGNVVLLSEREVGNFNGFLTEKSNPPKEIMLIEG